MFEGVSSCSSSSTGGDGGSARAWRQPQLDWAKLPPPPSPPPSPLPAVCLALDSGHPSLPPPSLALSPQPPCNPSLSAKSFFKGFVCAWQEGAGRKGQVSFNNHKLGHVIAWNKILDLRNGYTKYTKFARYFCLLACWLYSLFPANSESARWAFFCVLHSRLPTEVKSNPMGCDCV